MTDDYPRARNGRVLSGVCDRCGEPIYSYSDHDEDCRWSII